MIDWWWEIMETTNIWVATINEDLYSGAFVTIYVPTTCSSDIGRLVINAAKEVNPLRIQAYRLTYGSLP